jgi:hypothetical protein
MVLPIAFLQWMFADGGGSASVWALLIKCAAVLPGAYIGAELDSLPFDHFEVTRQARHFHISAGLENHLRKRRLTLILAPTGLSFDVISRPCLTIRLMSLIVYLDWSKMFFRLQSPILSYYRIPPKVSVDVWNEKPSA